MKNELDQLLDTETAARRLGISSSTLTKWRLTGEGPAFVKIGRHSVRYAPQALADFVAKRVRRSTSDRA